jgi:hypothetical protein
MLKSALGEPGWVGRAENPKASCRQPLVDRQAPDGKRVVDALLAELATKADAAKEDERKMHAPRHRKPKGT